MSSVKQYIKNPKFGQGDEPEFLPVGTTGIDAVKNRLLQVERQALNITIRDKKNYASLTEAIAAVTDDKYKVKGFQLQFSTDGKVWKHYLYNGDDASGWSSEDNWLEITYGEGGSSTHTLDLSPLFDEEGSPVATVSDEFLAEVKKAYEEKYSNAIYTFYGYKWTVPMQIIGMEGNYQISVNFIFNEKTAPALINHSFTIMSADKQVTNVLASATFEQSGSGTKALTDNGQYAEFVPEAPADGKTYGRNNKQWVETSGGGTQYLDLSMFTGETGTLSDEDYQKVVKAYEDGVTNFKVNIDGISINLYGTIEHSSIYYRIFVSGFLTVPPNNFLMIMLLGANSTDKSYESSITTANILGNGDGTKALTDNGEYAEFASPTKMEDGGTGAITKEIQPNTFYKFGECSSLTITLAAEKPGILNEYMFEFISGSIPTTLTDIPNVKWQNGNKLVPEANCTYQVSIVNNCAVYAKFPNA